MPSALAVAFFLRAAVTETAGSRQCLVMAVGLVASLRERARISCKEMRAKYTPKAGEFVESFIEGRVS